MNRREGRDVTADARDLDAGVRHSRRRVLGVLGYAVACVLAIVTTAFGVEIFELNGNTLVRVLVFVALLLATGFLFAAAEGLFVPSVRDVLDVDPRPPVLYLRPFEEDRPLVYDVISTGETMSVESAKAEDFLLLLNAIGPLVSIAEPDLAARIGIHPHGAYRDFVGEGDWQARVKQLLEGADLVVLAIGDSPGIEWEIAQVREHTGAENLLLYLPPRPVGALTKKGRLRREQAIYDGFKPLVEKYFDVQMPAFRKATFIIGFEPDGTPVLPVSTGSSGWYATERSRVAKQVQAQLVSVLERVRLGVDVDHYRVHGRAAMWARLSIAALFAVLALAAAIHAASTGGSGLLHPGMYGQIAFQALPGILLTTGWSLLARHFRRRWVWLVPVATGTLTLMNAVFNGFHMAYPGLIHDAGILLWYPAASTLLQLVYAVSVLVLGVVMLGRPSPTTTRS